MIGAIGMFDGVHLGHRALIDEVCAVARKRGEKSVIFTFDGHPLQTIAPERAPRLLTTPSQKKSLLEDAGIDRVVSLHFDEALRQLSAREFMLMLQKRHGLSTLVMGFNHRFGHDRLSDFAAYQKIGQEIGLEVIRANELVLDTVVGTVSSSAIRRALAEGGLDSANLMLGREYAILGHVSHGYRIGHKLGFPTANVAPDMAQQLIPQRGVYAGHLNGMPAMINIGIRPTVDTSDTLSIEAHILDYEGDLYETEVTLSFAHRLRDEQKFPSLEALRTQLQSDLSATRSLFTHLSKKDNS